MALQTTTFIARPTPATAITFNSARVQNNSFKFNIARTGRNAVVKVSAGGGGSNYVVPLDYNSPGITRPLAEILRDLNKRVPFNFCLGWCGEIRDVIFSDSGSVTVVYRVTVRGSDGEAHRESTGTVPAGNDQTVDPVAAAEELAFCKACARFGLGLYLYHED